MSPAPPCPLGEGGDPRLRLAPTGNPTDAPICGATKVSVVTGLLVRCVRPVDGEGGHLPDCLLPESSSYALDDHFGRTPRRMLSGVEEMVVVWRSEVPDAG